MTPNDSNTAGNAPDIAEEVHDEVEIEVYGKQNVGRQIVASHQPPSIFPPGQRRAKSVTASFIRSKQER